MPVLNRCQKPKRLKMTHEVRNLIHYWWESDLLNKTLLLDFKTHTTLISEILQKHHSWGINVLVYEDALLWVVVMAGSCWCPSGGDWTADRCAAVTHELHGCLHLWCVITRQKLLHRKGPAATLSFFKKEKAPILHVCLSELEETRRMTNSWYRPSPGVCWDGEWTLSIFSLRSSALQWFVSITNMYYFCNLRASEKILEYAESVPHFILWHMYLFRKKWWA